MCTPHSKLRLAEAPFRMAFTRPPPYPTDPGALVGWGDCHREGHHGELVAHTHEPLGAAVALEGGQASGVEWSGERSGVEWSGVWGLGRNQGDRVGSCQEGVLVALFPP